MSESEETFWFARLSEPSFAEDWDSPEDSIYDRVFRRLGSPSNKGGHRDI
jgi:hypothetical protein